MKFLTIITLFFLINVSASAINALDVMGVFKIQPQQDFVKSSTEDLLQQEYFQSSAVQDTASDWNFGDFTKGLSIFLTQTGLGVAAPFYLYKQFGLDPTLAYILAGPIYLLYAIAIMQFISNRATKSMD